MAGLRDDPLGLRSVLHRGDKRDLRGGRFSVPSVFVKL